MISQSNTNYFIYFQVISESIWVWLVIYRVSIVWVILIGLKGRLLLIIHIWIIIDDSRVLIWDHNCSIIEVHSLIVSRIIIWGLWIWNEILIYTIPGYLGLIIGNNYNILLSVVFSLYFRLLFFFILSFFSVYIEFNSYNSNYHHKNSKYKPNNP